MSEIKPLFIPLRKEYFFKFCHGKRIFESRKYGKRWNEKTCLSGRRVIISDGYGKKNRLSGHILFCDIVKDVNLQTVDFLDIYGPGNIEFRIWIAVDIPDRDLRERLDKEYERFSGFRK